MCTAGPCGCMVEGWPYSLVKECPLVRGWHLGLLNYQGSKFLLCCFSHKPCDVLLPQCELEDVTGVLSLCLCVGCSSLCGDKVPEEGSLGKEELIWPMTEVEEWWQEPKLTDHTVSEVRRDAGRGACLLWLSGSSKWHHCWDLVFSGLQFTHSSHRSSSSLSFFLSGSTISQHELLIDTLQGTLIFLNCVPGQHCLY